VSIIIIIIIFFCYSVSRLEGPLRTFFGIIVGTHHKFVLMKHGSTQNGFFPVVSLPYFCIQVVGNEITSYAYLKKINFLGVFHSGLHFTFACLLTS
jgi:hypothetical protein